MKRLGGLSALISGGASGVGRATAHRFAGTYAYLASADGAYTTGQNIVVDGGMTTNIFPVAAELQ